jgi:Zn-finger nucleic acid-binding protein
MKEPKWLPNPMTVECPVRDGHDVEVKFRDGGTKRDKSPQLRVWGDSGEFDDIIEYRDWTAFNEQNKKPNLSYEASYNRLDKLVNMQAKRLNEMESELIATLREIGVMAKRLSMDGDSMSLKMALNSKNRLNSYLQKINK